MDEGPQDEKYTVFKTNELYEMLGEIGLPPWTDGKGPAVGGELDCAVLTQAMDQRVKERSIKDAVVIRRQDKFASPALATYAACIAMVAMEHPDPKTKAELLAISDYFEDQAQKAAEEGFKLPDL
jgi:streptomycin 6-kinase